jgi:hypothetical protein
MEAPNDLLRHSTKGPILWSQPKAMRREYELTNGDDAVGHLRFQKSCGSLAIAEVGSRKWTFKREGFLNPSVTVRPSDSDQNLAVFRPSWTGSGMLEFSDGHRVQWRCRNFWGSEWCFLQNDQPVISFKQHTGIAKVSARLAVEPATATADDLSLLAALGWYLMLLTAQDAAITAVTASTVAISG